MKRRVPLRLRLAAALAVTLASLACGSDSPPAPTPITRFTLQVRVVTAAAGQPIVNATVRILDGVNAGRSAATDSSGTATLSSLEQSGFTIEVSAENYVKTTMAVTLTGAQTVTVSLTANAPPVIAWIRAQGSRPGQPAGFADLNEEITVTAGVSDLETPIAQLALAWVADGGAFIGSGPTVTWRAPATAATPKDYTLTLTVVEKTAAAALGAGREVPFDHSVTATTTVRVHDSRKEIGDLATQFLTDFSDSSIAPSVAVRHFSDACPGKGEELRDVINNRTKYLIRSYKLGVPATSVGFGSGCFFKGAFQMGDGCARLSCEWTSTVLATGATEVASGTCGLSAFYESRRWWLCDSWFDPKTAAGARFMR